MLSAATLLRAWERGGGEPPLRRPLLLLEAAFPERPADAWADLPVGRRDASLLELRETAFGRRLECVVACPACGEVLELSCDAAELRVPPGDDGPLVVRHGGVAAAFRLPTTRDLLAVVGRGGGDGDAGDGVRRLLARCLEGPAAVDELPPALLAAVEERMEEADPQASVRLVVTCPGCGHVSRPPFDIASYLWVEVDAWARRTLEEVHVLASAYGWSESEVLALTARRRQLYVERVRG